MNALPEWWNDLIEWFSTVREKNLAPNMAHAWRVKRYADRVCNSGFADYLDTHRSEVPKVLESLALVATPSHEQLLREALAFRAKCRPKRRLPKIAQVPRAIAYDGLFRGWPQEKVIESLTELCPACPRPLYPAILEVAAGEVAALSGWESLNATFHENESQLRLCIAGFSRQFIAEWQH